MPPGSAERAEALPFVVLSGCSGGGKSTLLAALGGQGFATIPEPGRRIVQDEMARGGTALPWLDLAAFARRAIALAIADHDAAGARRGPVFFDRGLVDAAAALEYATGEPAIERDGKARRYARQVFMTPPWPDIFAEDAERKHGFDDAAAEHERLVQAYQRLGYEIVMLPKTNVADRLDFVLGQSSG